MKTPNAGLYELTGDQKCITSMPLGERVMLYYPDGSAGAYTLMNYDYSTEAYAWTAIRPAKKKRWRGGFNGMYFFINSVGIVCKTFDNQSEHDDRHHNAGNYFPTKEQALASDLYRCYQNMKEALR